MQAWKPVTTDEIYVVLGVFILMGMLASVLITSRTTTQL